MTATVLIDDDGSYDPRQLNDRLVLGMKGAIAEYALALMRQRARYAFEAKIQRGHVMWEVPVGCVRTSADRIEQIADRQVQYAVAGVFGKCRELGSARQTMLWYREAQLPLPEGQPGPAGREILWRLPSGHRMNQMLTKPCYAGALEKARYEAQRAGRQYDLVDPEHRLVAGELEHRWNAALARVTEVAAHLATLQSQPSTLSEEQRQS